MQARKRAVSTASHPGLWLAVAATVLVGFAPACGGGGGEETRTVVSQAAASRDLNDGVPALTTTINVRFSRDIDLPDDELPLTSAFELAVPDPLDESSTERVFVAGAEQSEDDPREFVLQVASLVPDGSELFVAGRLFGGGAEQDVTAPVAGDLTPLQALLASVAMAPRDVSVLEAGAFAVPAGDEADASAMRAALEAHLGVRESSPELTTAALAAFDEMDTAIVPDAKLRAALAALTGTFAEPALADLFTSENCTGLPVARIAFEPPPDGPDLFARVTHAENGARIISVNPALLGEPLELLVSLLAHEAVHCDPRGSVREEIVAVSFDTLLYIQLLTVFPDLAHHGSPLSKDLNVDAIAMINSGRARPESVGLLPSPGVQLAIPDTNSTAGSFAEFVAQAYAGQPSESPSEPLATLYAAAFAPAAGLQASDAFDLEYLDAVIGAALDPVALVFAIGVLGLEPDE